MGEQDVARKPFDIVVCGPLGRIRPAATTSLPSSLVAF